MFDTHIETAANGRDILVEALAHLVAAEPCARARERDFDGFEEFAGCPGLRSVVDKEILDGEPAGFAGFPQDKGRIEHDQCRRHVADGRAVGDVAADGAGVADLDRSETPNNFTEVGEDVGDGRERLGIGHAGADGEPVGAPIDPSKFADAAQVNDGAELAVRLCHPQPNVRCPRDQHRVRVFGVTGGKAVEVSRRHEALAVGGKIDRLVVGAFQEPPAVGLEARCFPIGHRIVMGGGKGGGNGAVTGATAKVSGQEVRGAFRVHSLAGEVGGVHGHDEARRAEAALRRVFVDHGLLDRMQPPVRCLEVFDRQHRLAFQHADELHARVDSAVADFTVRRLADDHRTGPAIALGTALLGSSEALFFAQIFQKGEGRQGATKGACLAVQSKGYEIAHRRPP